MSIQVQVAHRMPGRARLLLPRHRGDPVFLERLCRQVAETGLVKTCRANPLTGSIVLEFAGEPDALLARLAASLPVEVEPVQAPPTTNRQLGRAQEPLKLVSGRDVNPMLMAGVLFGAVGIAQALRGRVMLPALTAFWYAANAFRMARAATEGSAVD